MDETIYESKVKAFEITYNNGVLHSVKVIEEDRINHNFLKEHIELYEKDLNRTFFKLSSNTNKMQFKFKTIDLQLLIGMLRSVDQMQFANDFEQKICKTVTLQILKKLVKKLADMKEDNTIKLDIHQAVVLRTVLPRLNVHDDYAATLLSELIIKTDQLCLSI